MAKINDTWTVGPHGPVEYLDEGLLTVAGEIRMPLCNFPRRMTVVALRFGRSAIWSAMSLREPQMAQVEAVGKPAFLIVPGIAHRLDLKAWKRRYPEARVICPPGARAAVEEVVPVDSTAAILDDPMVRLETVPGAGGKEAALIVRRDGSTTLVLNDLLGNIRHPHGLGAHVMVRLLGYGTRRAKMPWFDRQMFVEDVGAIAEAFRRWADEPGLARIIVSHGEVIVEDPRDVLLRVEKELAS
jgi:hypothetical protein